MGSHLGSDPHVKPSDDPSPEYDPWKAYKESGCKCQVEDAAGYPTIVLYSEDCTYLNHSELAKVSNAGAELEFVQDWLQTAREKLLFPRQAAGDPGGICRSCGLAFAHYLDQCKSCRQGTNRNNDKEYMSPGGQWERWQNYPAQNKLPLVKAQVALMRLGVSSCLTLLPGGRFYLEINMNDLSTEVNKVLDALDQANTNLATAQAALAPLNARLAADEANQLDATTQARLDTATANLTNQAVNSGTIVPPVTPGTEGLNDAGTTTGPVVATGSPGQVVPAGTSTETPLGTQVGNSPGFNGGTTAPVPQDTVIAGGGTDPTSTSLPASPASTTGGPSSDANVGDVGGGTVGGTVKGG